MILIIIVNSIGKSGNVKILLFKFIIQDEPIDSAFTYALSVAIL